MQMLCRTTVSWRDSAACRRLGVLNNPKYGPFVTCRKFHECDQTRNYLTESGRVGSSGKIKSMESRLKAAAQKGALPAFSERMYKNGTHTTMVDCAHIEKVIWTQERL